MNIEEAIKTAIEYEIRVRETYVETLDEHVDNAGKRVFKLLADEEDGHVRYLKGKLDEWLAEGRLTSDGLETALPPVEAGIDSLTGMGFWFEMPEFDLEVG
jgi:hypothetical protein